MGMLEGKVALITGTGRGQGRSAALAFTREGAKVVGVDLLARGERGDRCARPRCGWRDDCAAAGRPDGP